MRLEALSFHSEIGNVEFHVLRARHGQQIGDLPAPACEAAVLVDAEEHVRGLAVVGDEHGTLFGRLLRACGVLVELAAGQCGDDHDGDA